MKKKEIITLCSVCYADFRDNSNYKIRRVKRKIQETCTYCSFRIGYDYELTKKET